MSGARRMESQKGEFAGVPGVDQARRLARRRQAAERRHLPEGPPDRAQILNELVGDQQWLAVQALDQLAQPVNFDSVHLDRVVAVFVMALAAFGPGSKSLAESQFGSYFLVVGRAAAWVAPYELREGFRQGARALSSMRESAPENSKPSGSAASK